MTRPTPEYLTETMTRYASEAGYQKLRREGYIVPRSECQYIRNKLIREGVVKSRKWSEESIEKIRALAEEGKSGIEIAKIMGVSTSSLYDLFYKHRISTHKPQTPPPPRDEFAEIWLASTGVATAQHFKVTEKLVTRWARYYGLKRPPREKKPRIRPSQAKRKFGVTYTPTPVTTPTETGPLADAARYLRQQGYANVYRRGRDEWQVGGRVMREQDMLARVDEMKARRARMIGGVA